MSRKWVGDHPDDGYTTVPSGSDSRTARVERFHFRDDDPNWPAWFKVAVKRHGTYAKLIGPDEFERQFGSGYVALLKKEAAGK